MTTFDDDAVSYPAPKDNADLFRVWQPFMRNYAAKRGIHPNDVDDAASIMVLRHIERDTINNFDSSHVSVYKGKEHPARFKTYLGRSIDLDVRGIRDKNNRIQQKELPIGCIENRTELEAGPSRTPWLDVAGDVQEDHADAINDMIDAQAEHDTVRTMLAKVPRRNAQDQCDLVAFHDAVRQQMLDLGEKDLAQIAKLFNIAVTTAHQWWRFYQANMAAIYGRPVPAKRARRSRKDKP